MIIYNLSDHALLHCADAVHVTSVPTHAPLCCHLHDYKTAAANTILTEQMAGPDNIQISLVCFIYLMTYRDVSESDATAQTM